MLGVGLEFGGDTVARKLRKMPIDIASADSSMEGHRVSAIPNPARGVRGGASRPHRDVGESVGVFPDRPVGDGENVIDDVTDDDNFRHSALRPGSGNVTGHTNVVAHHIQVHPQALALRLTLNEVE